MKLPLLLLLSLPGQAQIDPAALRHDPRLQSNLVIVEINPKLSEVLKKLEKASGLAFTVDAKLAAHEPKLGGFSFNPAPVWMIMKVVATVDLAEGR